MERIGFVGLGIMGSRMAANLRRAGYELTVYNRTRETADAWAAEPPAEQLQRYPRWPNTQDRMISRSAPLEDILLYVDGSCSDKHTRGGATESKALCVVVFKPAQSDSIHKKDNSKRGLVFGFESYGPIGKLQAPTSDGAVLRAAIAAIELCDWVKEGRRQLTIASDSAYLVECITEHIGTWRRRGWRRASPTGPGSSPWPPWPTPRW